MEILKWCVQLPRPEDNQSAIMRYARVITACSSDTIQDASLPEDNQRRIFLCTVRDPALLLSGECGQDLFNWHFLYIFCDSEVTEMSLEL